MHIIQILDNDKPGAILRYADELKNASEIYYNDFSVNNYFFNVSNSNDKLLISESSFSLIEHADYLFIHSYLWINIILLLNYK